MTDTTPVLPTRLPPAPVSPTVSVPEPSPDTDLAALLTAFRLLQVQHARVMHHESAVRGLHATDSRCLFFLAAADGQGVTPKQVGEYLELSTGATTSLVDRLEQHGHIDRRPNPGDRRSVLLHLTPTGSAVAQEIGAVWAGAFRDAVAPGDRARLTGVLERLGAALDRRSGTPGRDDDETDVAAGV